MIALDLKKNIQRIKKQEWDAILESYFDGMSAKMLVSELTADYPIVFQKRQLGQKQEIGMAKELVYELRFRAPDQSPFMARFLLPSYRNCLLVSEYNDVVTEITWLRKVDVLPAQQDQNSLRLRFGRGVKIDKTIDGWEMKTLPKGERLLSKEILKKHGWQFEVLRPFGLAGLVSP